MLDTKAKTVMKAELETINLDTDSFVANNLAKMEDYLFDYLYGWHYESSVYKNQNLAIDATGVLSFANRQDTVKQLYGTTRTIRIKCNHKSVAEWAKTILKHYQAWFIKQAKLQKQMTPKELVALLNSGNDAPYVFTPAAYTNFAMAHLSELTPETIDLDFCCQDQQFYSKLLVTVNSITKIKRSLIAHLIDTLYQKKRTVREETQWQLIAQKLCDILFEHDHQTKLIKDRQVDYFNVIADVCQLPIDLKQITIPLQCLAMFSIYFNSKRARKPEELALTGQINYQIANQADLNKFMKDFAEAAINKDEHCASYLSFNSMVYAFKYFKSAKVKLGRYLIAFKNKLTYQMCEQVSLFDNQEAYDRAEQLCQLIFTA